MEKNILVCPNCKSDSLRQIAFHKTKVARCDQCQGLWFNRDELSKTVAEEDKFLEWLDIDLWKNKEGFKVVFSGKICPVCDKNLYQVNYNKSDIQVDVCNSCHGVWLDRGEFKKIINYLEQKVDTESLSEYFKDSIKQAQDLFTGPKELSSEIKDFFIVNKLLEYKFLSQHPIFTSLIANLPH
ncbi:zf-TFIIB domain-containing protein [Patescibacteria group bacterium]|nr:zf-TFIIB domain-containing protein [Patescibacteria group bacterium]